MWTSFFMTIRIERNIAYYIQYKLYESVIQKGHVLGLVDNDDVELLHGDIFSQITSSFYIRIGYGSRM